MHATRRELSRPLPARRRVQSNSATHERARDALALARSGAGVVVTQQVDQAALEQAYACLDYWKASLRRGRRGRPCSARYQCTDQSVVSPKARQGARDPLRDWPTTSSAQASLVWGPQGIAFCGGAEKTFGGRETDLECMLPAPGFTNVRRELSLGYSSSMEEQGTIAGTYQSVDAYTTPDNMPSRFKVLRVPGPWSRWRPKAYWPSRRWTPEMRQHLPSNSIQTA